MLGEHTDRLPSTRVSLYAANAKAENTKRPYRIDWDDFVAWCRLHGRQVMPATPETVRQYLECLAEAGAKVATIRRLASISVATRCGATRTTNRTLPAPPR